MSRNGAGVYSLPAGNPVVTGTTIQSTWANNTLTDIATAITGSVAADGQTPITANIPMGNFKVTSLGAGTSATDATNLRQVQYQAYTWAGNAGGTGNALTLTMNPSIGAYAAGQRFAFKATAINTGAATVAIDGLAAIPIQFNGAALVGNEIQTGYWYSVFFDTATTCQLSAITSPSIVNPPVTIASAATTPIGLGLGASNQVTISGTTTITAFDTIAAGTIRYVTYSGAVPITYNATSMQLVGAVSRTNAVGDVSIFESLGGGNWKELVYQPVSGIFKAQTYEPQTFSATMATNACTIAAVNSIPLAFRSTTLGSGVVGTAIATPSANLVIPAGATLGTVNGVLSGILVAEMNNGGTREFAVCNMAGGLQCDERNLISTTAISASATAANVWYSTTARTSLPYRIIGYFESTQATAGQWASAASLVQSAFGEALTALSSIGFGQTEQNVLGSRAVNTTYYNTTGKPIEVTISAVVVSGSSINFAVNGTSVMQDSGLVNSPFHISKIISPGESYSLVTTGSPTIQKWSEKR